MKTIQVITWICVAMTTAASVVGQESSGDRRNDRGERGSKWRAQVGWVHQWNRGMKVSDSDPARSESPSGVTEVGGRNLRSDVPPVTYPDSDVLIPRTFDDGYVRPDYWTGDRALLDGPNPERFGTTWNWGADRADQYNYDGGRHPTLTFRLDRGDAVLGGDAVVSGDSGEQKSDLPTDGIEVKLNRRLYSWMNNGDDGGQAVSNVFMNMDLVFRLAWFPKDEQHYRRSSSQSVFAISEVYTYHDFYGGSGAPGGTYPPLVVPYAGSYGSDTTAGPLIPVTPESVRQVRRYMGSIRNNVEVTSEAWHLRGAAGLEFGKALTKRLSLYVAPQFVLELVHMDVERIESVTYTSGASGQTTTVATHADSASKTEVVPGFLLTAGADYRFAGEWFAGIGFGWEWLTSNPSVRVGQYRVRYDLEGGELNLYLGRWL